jgi:hypothetical protein
MKNEGLVDSCRATHNKISFTHNQWFTGYLKIPELSAQKGSFKSDSPGSKNKECFDVCHKHDFRLQTSHFETSGLSEESDKAKNKPRLESL